MISGKFGRLEIMADVGVVRVPRARWGGRWLQGLREVAAGPSAEDDVGAWHAVADYAGTSSYQVARALNLGVVVPDAGQGLRWEFGSRLEEDGTSTLLVRQVEDREVRSHHSA